MYVLLFLHPLFLIYNKKQMQRDNNISLGIGGGGMKYAGDVIVTGQLVLSRAVFPTANMWNLPFSQV